MTWFLAPMHAGLDDTLRYTRDVGIFAKRDWLQQYSEQNTQQTSDALEHQSFFQFRVQEPACPQLASAPTEASGDFVF